ncbi:unnamed protein product [Dicrocoelium dendriticum]|nr:unnamed protein product [Dicrocoelium dendriticum]
MDLIAPNLFSALKVLLDRKLVAGQELLNKLEIFARKHQIPITVSESAIRARLHTCVCPTLNGIGLRINLRESGLGYRPLSVSNSKLSSILQHVVGADTDENRLSKLEAVDELVTFAQFACDEGDFGQSLELGLSMLAFHPKDLPLEKANVLNSRISCLLGVGYRLAGRYEFSDVIQAHMNARRTDPMTMPTDLFSPGLLITDR